MIEKSSRLADTQLKLLGEYFKPGSNKDLVRMKLDQIERDMDRLGIAKKPFEPPNRKKIY